MTRPLHAQMAASLLGACAASTRPLEASMTACRFGDYGIALSLHKACAR